MTTTDTVADLLTRIRNAKDAKHKYVDVKLSKFNQSIVNVFKENGYITHFLVNEKRREIRVFLKYVKETKQNVIHGLKRMSRPGLRKYIGYKEIPRVFSGLGIAVLSTPAGVIEGKQAKKLKIGGELLCFVW